MKPVPTEKKDNPRKGLIFIVSAPSGAGKTTLCNILRDKFPDLRYSVSYTSRSPRPGDVHGVHYYFISVEEFMKRIDEERWAEWAIVHDNYYGTSADYLTEVIHSGNDILLAIDVQGAESIVKKFPDSITIFIMPPSMEELEKRLLRRKTDDPEVIRKRIINAQKEIAKRSLYRHVIINNVLQTASNELISIVESYKRAKI